jgi:23S rRNA (guanosine2251-2'-O)-methyltransferase
VTSPAPLNPDPSIPAGITRTRCPKPDCGRVFEVPASRLGRNGDCPSCGWRFTFTDIAVLDRTEAERRALAERGARSDAARHPVAAVLEDVRSLWNVGSIFRTAEGAGLAKLYLTGITGRPPRKELAKTSLGAEESVPWEHLPTALEAVARLRADGFRVLALENTPGSRLIREIDPTPPLAFVVGNEVTGVSRPVLEAVEARIRLPMYGAKASLNVAVAFGIAAYEIVERVRGLEG